MAIEAGLTHRYEIKDLHWPSLNKACNLGVNPSYPIFLLTGNGYDVILVL